MKIDVLYLAGCPNYLPTLARLKRVLREEGVPGEIFELEVSDAHQAMALGFFGSPTIRINGLDIDRDCRNMAETGMACRRYPGGLPPEGMIRAALKEAGK